MTEAHPQAAPLHGDPWSAEALLFDLAAELGRAPVHATLRLHVRALQIKRIVTRWAEQRPDEASQRAVVDEILALQTEVRTLTARASASSALKERFLAGMNALSVAGG